MHQMPTKLEDISSTLKFRLAKQNWLRNICVKESNKSLLSSSLSCGIYLLKTLFIKFTLLFQGLRKGQEKGGGPGPGEWGELDEGGGPGM